MWGRITVKVVGQWLEAKSGRQTEKESKKRHSRKGRCISTPAVNETAYLSAVSVMCKQRPFRPARHTIVLFAMQ